MAFFFHRATARGEGAITLFELYGDGAGEAIRKLVRPRSGRALGRERATLADLTDGGESVLDEVIVAPVEPTAMWSRLAAWTLTLHGSVWLERRVGEVLVGLGGTRLDRDGVLAHSLAQGTLDAIEAAAFAALVEAETPLGARFFARQHAGELSARLARVIAHLESGAADRARDELETLAAGACFARRLSAPLDVQLLGRANAGKSTLFNRLAEDERVAVTPLAGTTRDLVEERIAIEGFPVRLTDSAGLRLGDEVREDERLAAARALERVRADPEVRVLYLIPAGTEANETDRQVLDSLHPARTIVVRTMSDRVAGARTADRDARRPSIEIAAAKGEGLDRLRVAILAHWIAGGGSWRALEDVPCAPFTRTQERLVLQAACTLARDSVRVDDVRRQLIECLRSSWPEPHNAPTLVP